MAGLSPSKIRTYERCPLQYKLQSEPWPDGPARPGPSPELAVDRAVHDALDVFYAEAVEGKDGGIARLIELLREGWPQDVFNSPEDAASSLELWQQRLTRYVGVETASAAKVVSSKQFLSGLVAGCRVNGIIDRIDRQPGGALELIDFKTGRPPRETDLSRDNSAAITFASACADSNVAQLGVPLRYSHLYLQNQQRVSVVFTQEQLAKAAASVSAVAEGIQAGLYPAKRGPQCSNCEQLPRCPAWPVMPRAMVGEDAETYARRLRASYSKLSLYKNCPRSYSKNYVERVATGNKPFFDLGHAIHETLESFHGEKPDQGAKLEDLLALYEQSFAAHQEGYRTEQERQRYYLKGREMLERYHRQFVEGGGRKVAWKVEEYFELPIGDRTIINGYIDRIDRNENGRLVVLDYKTESTERTQDELDSDLQLGIYAWACRRMYDEPADLGLFMLAHDRLALTTRTDEQLVDVERQVDELARQIQEDRVFAPKLNRHCPDCDFLHDCSLRPQVEEAVARGELRPAGFAEGEA